MKSHVARYQNDLQRLITRHVVGPAWAMWERSSYMQHYRRLKASQYDSPINVTNRQKNKLIQIFQYALSETEFYQERFRDSGFDWDVFEKTGSFQRFPLLTKSDLIKSSAQLTARSFSDRPNKTHRKTTSGSTGTSVSVIVDDEAQQFKRACTRYINEWSGWEYGEPIACVWGNPEYQKRGWRGRLRNAILEKATYLDTLEMNEVSMSRFRTVLQRNPPSLLFGHAHSLYLFACFCKANGGAGFSPRGIISTAMVLHDWEREVIEQVFLCSVTNRYGCEEVSLIASECEAHRGLHVNTDGVFVEILRADGSPCEPGEVGAIAVTDLVNRAMPIIRYQVGDMGSYSAERCSCGRGLPLLERIEGRIADYVTTANGQMISGISLTENFATLVPGLVQLQIVQEAVDQFVFRVVKGPEWDSKSVETVANLVCERFGDSAMFNFDFVERIPHEPSGKYRFCISKVANPWLR
jgi:phenylacetate-CoA ligase